jgi:hypothetical protein
LLGVEMGRNDRSCATQSWPGMLASSSVMVFNIN